MPDISLVRAHEPDLELVLDILAEAAKWMRAERGVYDQWPERFPAHIFQKAIELGEMYLIMQDGACVGTRRTQTADEGTWGPDDRLAMYCHSLAIRRAFTGRGISQVVYGLVREMGLALDRPLLRLDCLASNRGLRAHYERLGFQRRGEVKQFDGGASWMSMRYERDW